MKFRFQYINVMKLGKSFVKMAFIGWERNLRCQLLLKGENELDNMFLKFFYSVRFVLSYKKMSRQHGRTEKHVEIRNADVSMYAYFSDTLASCTRFCTYLDLLRTSAMFSTSDMFTLDFLLMTLPRNSSTVLSSSLRYTRSSVKKKMKKTTTFISFVVCCTGVESDNIKHIPGVIPPASRVWPNASV